MIQAKTGGMFCPQEKGPCKLTVIIPEDDPTSQNYAFTNLRYADIVIGIPGEQGENPEKVAVMTAAGQIAGTANSMVAPYGYEYVIRKIDVPHSTTQTDPQLLIEEKEEVTA